MTLDSDGSGARWRPGSTLARRFAALAALTLLLAAGRARAQEDSDAETRTIARELAMQGAEALDAKDYATALDRFERAGALVRAPSLTVMQARALVALGRFVEALDKYEETQRMPLPPDAAEAFTEAVHDAAREASELRARLPWLRISLLRAAGASPEVEVSLDGKPVAPATLDVERPIDPGAHEVELRAPGKVLERHSVTLREGEHRSLELSAATPRPLTPVATPTPVSSRPHSGGWSRQHSAFVAFGVGAAGLAGSLITGVMALNQRAELASVCHPGCPESSEDELSGYRRNRALSYVGLGVGLVGAGVGGYLLLSGSPDSAHVAVGASSSSAWLRAKF